MDFAEFTLGFVESEVECGNSIGWRDGMSGGVDHFQWESVGYELEKGNRMQFLFHVGTNGNK